MHKIPPSTTIHGHFFKIPNDRHHQRKDDHRPTENDLHEKRGHENPLYMMKSTDGIDVSGVPIHMAQVH